jgi:anti-sigma factor (TIGR02949 family)
LEETPKKAGKSGWVDCQDAVHQLYHYLDGELTDEKRTAIARHLDLCPPCSDGFDFEGELRRLIARKCRDDVPPELKARIAEAIHHQDHP